jgi:hypothetical protein
MRKTITVIKREFWIVSAILGAIAFLTALYSERFWLKLCLIPLSLLLIFIGAMKLKENEHTIIVRFLEVKKLHGRKDL